MNLTASFLNYLSPFTMENNLTICIEKLSLGIIPQQSFLLQLIDFKIVQSRIDGRVANDGRMRVVLSDGKHYGSNFPYYFKRGLMH